MKYFYLIPLLFSCAPSSHSEVQYGQLQSETQNFGFLELKPFSSIGICGNKASLTQTALQKWLQAAGRDQDLKIINKCDTPYWISVSLDNTCEPYVLGWHEGNAKTHTIGLCHINQREDNEVYTTILHELGHSFGLCDQYSTSQGIFTDKSFHENCSPLIRSKTAEESIMNGGGEKAELTPDDTLGIRILSCLEENSVNKIWAQKIPHVYEEWKKDPLFQKEIKRLQEQKIKIIPECLLTQENSVKDESCLDFQVIQKIDKKEKEWLWFHLEITGNLSNIEKVEYHIDDTFEKAKYLSSEKNLNFKTISYGTYETGWSTQKTTLFLKNGKKCLKEGTVIKP